MKAVSIVVSVALATGCFGYTPSAKKWSYVGNVVLLAGGAATIAADIATRPGSCTPMSNGMGCPLYTPPFDGALVAGVMLITAGVIGIVLNATRAELKTSR
jgi:hypothetical protein